VLVVLNNCKQTDTGGVKSKPLNAWGRDSLGCKQLRTEQLAQQMVEDGKLMNDSKEKFLSVFYNPDTTAAQVERGYMLIYYMNNMCEKGRQIPNSDKCYATFYFRNNKLVDMDFTCE
jgi:hypothetical protein